MGDAEGRRIGHQVARQHPQAGCGVPSLVADGNERIGRQLWVGQLLAGRIVQVPEGALGSILQHDGLGGHRQDEGGQDDRRLLGVDGSRGSAGGRMDRRGGRSIPFG
jgi:hypothetical protein